jgi:superfamily II DNA or RNA helicase
METITKEELIRTDPKLKSRPYQLDALLSIFLYAKCLVKMFCGTGKSKIITNVIIHTKKGLSVVVFPSLALIKQYSADYLNNKEYVRHFKKHKTMNVSSEKLENMESTTDVKEIKKFLKYKSPKIILVTYQSYQVLLNCLEGQKIGLVCYDEAHHVTSPETQKLVFGTAYYEKEVFFTATPKNENGITMFDREYTEKNMCGPMAYDYTYLQGLNDDVLNAFDICIDMYTDDNNASIYTAISRAIISRNNNRVLSFHSGVNGESNTNVWNFVKETEFQDAFNKVIESEFPEKAGYYKKITFKGMDGTTPSTDRVSMLDELYNTTDNEIYIISSCETIGEGVDTKKANMCVFADPKSSSRKIIQNIGRVVRPQDKRSTILIPCYVSMENYAAVKHDRVKTDELIREQMRSGKGDYECILNVLAALKQEDQELYEMCLNYPNRKVKEDSLQKQGFRICEADLDASEADDLDESDYSAEEVEQMKADGEPLEIHTNEMVEQFNEESEERLRRLYHDEEEDVYKPIVRITDASASEAQAKRVHPRVQKRTPMTAKSSNRLLNQKIA